MIREDDYDEMDTCQHLEVVHLKNHGQRQTKNKRAHACQVTSLLPIDHKIRSPPIGGAGQNAVPPQLENLCRHSVS